MGESLSVPPAKTCSLHYSTVQAKTDDAHPPRANHPGHVWLLGVDWWPDGPVLPCGVGSRQRVS